MAFTSSFLMAVVQLGFRLEYLKMASQLFNNSWMALEILFFVISRKELWKMMFMKYIPLLPPLRNL